MTNLQDQLIEGLMSGRFESKFGQAILQHHSEFYGLFT